MRLKENRIILLFVGMFLVGGCGRPPGHVRQNLLPTLNPTEFVFGATVADLQSAITRAGAQNFGLHYTQHLPSVSYQTSFSIKRHQTDVYHVYPELSVPGNENDAWLTTDSEPVSLSQVYTKEDGTPLPFLAKFHLHLKPESGTLASVRVIAHETYVRYGLTQNGPHNFQPANLEIAVPGTTVEEYRILLAIGKELGVTNMPELTLPPKGGRSVTITAKPEL